MSIFLGIVEWISLIILVIVGIVVGVFVLIRLDGLFTRGSLKQQFVVEKHRGSTGGLTEFIALPGVMGDHTSIDPIKDTILDYGDLQCVGYGYEIFDADRAVRSIAHRLVGKQEVVLILTSMSGITGLDVIAKLNTTSVAPKTIGCIFVDCVNGSKNLGAPNNLLAHPARALPFGKVSNALINPLLKKGLVPPKDDEIEEGLDKETVKRDAWQVCRVLTCR